MKKIFAILILTLAVFTIFSQVSTAAADPLDPTGTICSSPGAANTAVCNKKSITVAGPGGILYKVVDILSIVVGIVSVFVIIIAGIQYITSGGESARVNTAKNTILFAIVGLVIVGIAQIALAFFLNHL